MTPEADRQPADYPESAVYFDDGDLKRLPGDMKARLVKAAREIDLDHLPLLAGSEGRWIEPGM